GRTMDLVDAIGAHKSLGNFKFGPSEANAVIDRFNALGEGDKQDLLNFLRSLQSRRAGGTVPMAAPPVYAFLHGGGLAPDSVAQPEPDVCVVPRDPHAYRDAHPSRAALVVEIAETSYRPDRDYKFSLYARAGIADCWLVDVVDEAVEVHQRATVGVTGAARRRDWRRSSAR